MTSTSRTLRWSARDWERPLVEQVAWFNRLRFLVVASLFVATIGGAELLDVLSDPVPLYVLGGFTLAINLCYIAWYPRLTDEGAVRRHVVIQIGLDLLILTLILHFSGGVTNPIVLFYTFHTFIASMLLSARVAVRVAAVSIVLIAMLGLGEHYGLIPHRPVRIGLLRDAGIDALAAWIATLAIVLGVTVYFVSTILARLRASERELVGLTRQLALSEKLASIGTLAAGVSHEINNPVGVIANKTEIMRYRIADGDEDALVIAELDTIDKHVGRIRAITEGLLAFSREAPFEMRTLVVADLVREAADLARVSFQHANVRIEVRPISRALRVSGSSNHLLQVLVNVLLNARDASEPGSVVEVEAVAEAGEVVIRIVDHGAGIEPDVLGKIFDPFFTTKDVDRGTGLGLALSHGLVERHGGRIEVESEVGQGSRFSIWLPREEV